MASLQAVATSLPPHRLRTADAEQVLAVLLPGHDGARSVLRNARIDERHLVKPLEWYLEPRGFQERSQAYVEAAMPMARSAARTAIERAGLAPDDVGGVVFASTTGMATPSLDARLVESLGLPRDAVRVPLWGLGCAAGVSGLARAADLADATRRPILLVALEACSLAFPGHLASPGGGGVDKKNMVAASLFGDGCGAAVVVPDDGRAGPPDADGRPLQGDAGVAEAMPGVASAAERRADHPLQVRASGSHLYEDSERVMGWDVLDDRFEVVLSPEIPELVRASLRGLTDAFLDRHLGGRPDHWVLHPGGAKVVDAMRDALELHNGELASTEAVLRRHGNMSSPTVLFALDDAWPRIQSGQTALLAALGPGFAAEFLLLEAGGAP